MDRRNFLKATGAAAAGLAVAGLAPEAAAWNRQEKALFGPKMKGHFTMKQISSVTDTIGNSYLFRTKGGKVIIVDGGFETESDNLRKNIAEAGGHVDYWFITHPHQDHMGAGQRRRRASVLPDHRRHDFGHRLHRTAHRRSPLRHRRHRDHGPLRGPS